MPDWKNKRIGIVLSGGGAKGSYQAGMFEALEALGLKDSIKILSGCSAGAMNAAVYSCLGPEAIMSGTAEIGNTFKNFALLKERTVRESRKMVEAGQVSLEEFLQQPRFVKYDTVDFDRVAESYLKEPAMKSLRHRIHICCYNLEACRPEYFCLNELSYPEQLKLIKASGSLPFLFPAVEHRGCHYLDGGVVPGVCRSSAAADKIPLLPLASEELDAVLVCFLKPEDRVHRSLIDEKTEYLELRPSRPLEAIPGMGTLDFSPESLESHRELGYIDTINLFKE